MDEKLKHLEFIQNVISRMNSNSFLLKGWCITLVSALFVLSAKDANSLFMLITYIPLPAFWILDGFYISQERQYRDLYDEVANIPLQNINFSMNAKKFNKGRNTWLSGMLSKTLIPFYSTIILTIFILMGIL